MRRGLGLNRLGGLTGRLGFPARSLLRRGLALLFHRLILAEQLEKDELAALSRHNTTMAIFLGIDKIRDIVDNLDRPGDTPVAVVYHASWPDEKVLQGTLADIAEKVEAAGISKSALILVGGVVTRTGFRRSHLYRDR